MRLAIGFLLLTVGAVVVRGPSEAAAATGYVLGVAGALLVGSA